MATSNKKIALHLTDLPDHLLAEIFLRLPDPADLARASAACVTFRRLATDRYFLRRFRCLHTPPLLGFLDRDGFHPALPPHPSAPAARALAISADLSFSFLPSHHLWTVQDSRDGRVLLHRGPKMCEVTPIFRELAACDPLRRWYLVLPRVPDDLAASVGRCRCKPSLFPLGDDEEEAAAQEASFRVIWMAYSETKLAAFVFSWSTGQWRAAASKGWSDLVLSGSESAMMPQVHPLFIRHHYAYGCFYWDWTLFWRKTLLMLDTRRMEFSIVVPPPGEWRKEGFAVVEAGEGRLGMFGFHGQPASDLTYTFAQNKGENPSQWHMEKIISLDSGYRYYIIAVNARYLLLIRTPDISQVNPLFEYFLIDVKTLRLQRVYSHYNRLKFVGTHIYTNFPPSLWSSHTNMKW
ncbi:uncharacterized protein [Aegilops tauschii subsp. strangulata]|uniref:Uncharacterized protein n=1 Tax=Aegilops tauschii TaxID=37682 RepID=M8BMF2_AEGTA|nr:uncharacterized protein LOC109761634 [Aegilops tauschii subsp. strangulata]